jgi:Rod binding domain-containing protein
MIIRALLLALLVSACAPQPMVPVAASTDNVDGLEQVSSRYFDIAFVRPGVNFGHYRELLLNDSELAFKTPDRSQRQFPLSAEQKDRFRQMLDAQFAAELADLGNLRLADKVGPAVLVLQIRVQDILTTVPAQATGGAGWGSLSLRALGEATLVIELHDSESGEILARVYDRRAVEGIAVAQKQAAPLTRWEDADAICKQWAATVRQRLDALILQEPR